VQDFFHQYCHVIWDDSTEAREIKAAAATRKFSAPPAAPVPPPATWNQKGSKKKAGLSHGT